MTNGEKQALQYAAARIKSLASLENAGFDFNKDKDQYIKQKISPYMQWFELVADNLEQLAAAENGWEKKMIIERIINTCY